MIMIQIRENDIIRVWEGSTSCWASEKQKQNQLSIHTIDSAAVEAKKQTNKKEKCIFVLTPTSYSTNTSNVEYFYWFSIDIDDICSRRQQE